MLQCPSCQQDALQYAYLEEAFPCQTCEQCGGNWVLLTDYLQWQATFNKNNTAQEVDAQIEEVELKDSTQALICPVSKSLMMKYRISSKTTHRLDLSSSVNGIWLDKGEWQLLKQEGLTGKLNNIFTDPWQKRIRAESAHEAFAAAYERQFGKEAYQQLKTFREWLGHQEKRPEMLAYLIANKPYDTIN